MPEVRLSRIEPILSVPDVVAAVAYYKERLGFTSGWTWGEPPTHAGVNWHKVGLQFSLVQPFVATGAEFYLNTTDAATLYGQHRAAGVEVLLELEAKPWGMLEYTVRDLNGYRLRFAQQHHALGPQAAPVAGIVIEHRLPNIEEYERLIRAVGWTNFTNFETLPLALRAPVYGVVAVHEREVVGCALLLGDNASFLYIKDVMVHPRYQRQGIGTMMMEKLMTWAETYAPDRTLAGLFTGSGLIGFYEKFGFSGPEGLVGMSRVIRRK